MGAAEGIGRSQIQHVELDRESTAGILATLVFVNTRRLAERAGIELEERQLSPEEERRQQQLPGVGEHQARGGIL